MNDSPPVPKEQVRSGDDGAPAAKDAANPDRRDLETGVPSGQPGDADVNLDTQGRFGNLKQNLTNQWKVQDR